MTWAPIHRLDRFQREHGAVAFPLAVAKKFGDDQAGSLAALIAYYGFVSIFPLLMVLVTVSELVLRNQDDLRSRLLDSALAQFPVIGSRIQAAVNPVPSRGWLIAVGVVTSAWSGLAVIGAAERAVNDVWDVPRHRRPSFVEARLRALALLAILGTFLLLTTLGTAAIPAAGNSVLAAVGGLALGAALDTALALAAFSALTAVDAGWRAHTSGAVAAGCAWAALQAVGGYVVERRLRGSSDVYGLFAVAIGLLAWIYLAAQVFLIGAEINVVKARRLWPRGLFPPPLQPEDHRALADETREGIPREDMDVDVRVRDGAGSGDDIPSPPAQGFPKHGRG